MSDPIMFSDVRDREILERKRLTDRKQTLDSIEASKKRVLTPEEIAERNEIVGKISGSAVVDPLFQAVKNAIAPSVEGHKNGLFPSQQFLSAKSVAQDDAELAEYLVNDLSSFADYAKANYLVTHVTDLLSGYIAAQALSPNAVTRLNRIKAPFALYDSNLVLGIDPTSERTKLSDSLNKIKDGANKDKLAAQLAMAVSDGLPSEASTLVLWLQRLSASAAGLNDDEKLLSAVYGLIEADRLQPPPFRLLSVKEAQAAHDSARKHPFTTQIFSRLGEYKASIELFEAVLPILVDAGSRQPTDTVSAEEWALVVRNLVRRGINENEPQLQRRVNEALDSVQATGDDLPPSLIGIDLPDIDGPTTILKDNILALQPGYFASMFEEMKAFAVVDRLVELFQNGVLPVGRGNAGNALFRYWKDTAIRVSENERRNFYSRALGAVGGDDGGLPNREFNDLFLRFVSSVSSFLRQNNVDDLLRTKLPGAISQQQVRKSGRDLAANLSLHGYGMAYFMATELQKQVKDVIAILSDAEIMSAYGARDMWQVIDQVAATDLGGARNSIRYRTMAASGAIIIAWLANHAVELSSGSFDSILDIDEIRNPPLRRAGVKPTTDPTDADLVNACEQWLAVTGTQDEMVEDYSQRRESPNMPSKPIQIPAIAREMLDSAGISSPMGVNGNGRYAYR